MENCNEMTTFTSQMFLSLGIDEDKVRSLLDKCSAEVSNQHRAFFDLLLERNKKSLLNKAPFDKQEKKVFLDIGYGKSSITIFKDNRILYFSILPVGGRHITKDISLLLKISEKEADNLKKSLNQSETIFNDQEDKNNEREIPDLSNQVIFARVDEIIQLNLADEYFNAFFQNKDNCILIFIGEGSKILNKNSIYLEEKFDFFNEISFFEENATSICESGFNFTQLVKSQEVNFLTKKPKNRGFFEKFFHFFD